MKKVFLSAALVILIVVFAIALTGCSGNETDGVVNVFNWGEFINPEVLDIFEREYGIRVNYRTFESNEVLYSLLRSGAANADVIIPSDYMIARLIEEEMLYELDFSNIPNYTLIDERFRNLEFDPHGRYSVAYMTGTVGIIYNTSYVEGPVTSWNILWDERYAGRILMFDNQRDAFGIALKYLGFSQNTVNEDEIMAAFDLLVAQRPFLQAYVMDQIFGLMESGDAWIGPYYMGDFLWMHQTNPDLAFARPVEGSNAFVDAMAIPRGAENRRNAELFINFMSRTDIALMNMSYIMYASANYEAARAFALEIEPWKYEIMFASDEILANHDYFTHLPRHILELYDRLWVELKS